jgi:DnaJ domain
MAAPPFAGFADRLATLQNRQHLQQSGATPQTQQVDVDAQHVGAPSVAQAAAACCTAPADAGLLQRLRLLQNRGEAGDVAAAHHQQQQQQHDVMNKRTSAAERPEDYVTRLRALLSSQTDRQGHDVSSGGNSSQGGGASPMCTSPSGGAPPHADADAMSRGAVLSEHDHAATQNSSGGCGIVPEHATRLLVLARRSLAAGQHSEALRCAALVTATLPSIPGDGSSGSATATASSAVAMAAREAQQLAALARVLEHTAAGRWFAALQLQQQHASGEQGVSAGCVRAAYRRLAALVHPDKCQHTAAEEGFRALTQAYSRALAEVGDDGAKDGHGGVGDGEGGDDMLSEGYAWWSEWEADVRRDGPDGGAAAAATGSTAHTGLGVEEVQEDAELWTASLAELAAEVEQRQAAVLTPTRPDDIAHLPATRQRRLRAARQVLAARIQEQRANYISSPACGGFMSAAGEEVAKRARHD